MTDIKICGLRESSHLTLAASLGARFAGFVFFARSPRNLGREEAAALVKAAPSALQTAGLFVDPEDGFLSDILDHVPLGMLQLHGQESPRRVAEIRSRFNRPVIKAVSVAGPEDLAVLAEYEAVADWILFDAKAPAGSVLPGGNGFVFDWTILKDIKPRKPWMLSGGLTPENVGTGLKMLQPDAVDVSSGVEASAGVKSADKIKAFIQAVKES